MDNHELAAVRRRGLRVLEWAAWAASAAFLLLAANVFLALVDRWLAMLETLRRTAGLARPAAGPDWFLAAGLALALAVPALLLMVVWARYRAVWRRRLGEVWARPGEMRRHSRVPVLPPLAAGRHLARQRAYLEALESSPPWRGRLPAPAAAEDPAAFCRAGAVRFLSVLEPEIARRAMLTGTVVGTGGSRALDLATIAFAALEMQLYVLCALGKRPSPRMWATLWRNTAASLFLNTYLNREETCALTLAVKKAGLGLQAAADLSDQALDSLEDVDWENLLGDSAAELGGIASLAGYFVGVGASGVRQVGRLIDRYGDELLQGILAGGILYYHGVEIAADCLAVDQAHRAAPELHRSVREAAGTVCASAAGLVRVQAQELRGALRDRRRQVLSAVQEKAKAAARSAAHTTAGAPGRLWGNVRNIFNRGDKAEQDPEPGK